MKKTWIIILIVANIVLLVVGIITIPPHFARTNNPVSPSTRETTRGQNLPSGNESRLTIATTRPSVQTSSVPVISTTAPVASPVPSQTTPSSQTALPSQTASSAPTSINTTEPTSLSTTERPELLDFLWYMEDVFFNGVPPHINRIINYDHCSGGWKALILYDPDNEHDASAMQFLNVEISGSPENVKLTLDWYLIFWSNVGESVDETGLENAHFSGRWENNRLWASGAGTIRLNDFYSLNGKQYAVGVMDTPDGIPATIALVRP